MKDWKANYLKDKCRYSNASMLSNHALRFSWLLRRYRSSGNPIWKLAYHRMSLRYGLEISPDAHIGGGLYLGHAFCITVNPGVTLGSNCNLHKGVTIGAENRGKRKGCPKNGGRVWIGSNAVVVGKITIGNDVLIAPCSYVNRNVPGHSIAIGNPCKVIPRDNATESYINNRADT